MEFDTITRREALDKLFCGYKPLAETELCDINRALGRITAEDIFSINCQPVFRASKMDGIAVRSSDFSGEPPDTKSFRLGADYVRADTGDDFDDDFDAVIMIEDVNLLDEGFTLVPGVRVESGKNIVAGGADLAKGDLLIGAGRRLRAFDLTVLARGGLTEVRVVKRPIVAFIPTGSELVPVGTLPARGEIIDSNSVLASHMLREMGAEVHTLPIVKDIQSDLETSLDKALSFADIVVIGGGSSKGKDDLSHGLIAAKGKLLCHGTLSAPGRPVGIALTEDGKPLINVPGPMIACYFVFDWCLREIIARALGVTPVRPPRMKAVLTEDLNTPGSIEFLNRLRITRADGRLFATPLTLNREPGRPYVIGADSGQFVNEIGVSLYPKGSEIEVELLCAPEEFWD